MQSASVSVGSSFRAHAIFGLWHAYMAFAEPAGNCRLTKEHDTSCLDTHVQSIYVNLQLGVSVSRCE